jgi:hypothetical protein
MLCQIVEENPNDAPSKNPFFARSVLKYIIFARYVSAYAELE